MRHAAELHWIRFRGFSPAHDRAPSLDVTAQSRSMLKHTEPARACHWITSSGTTREFSCGVIQLRLATTARCFTDYSLFQSLPSASALRMLPWFGATPGTA